MEVGALLAVMASGNFEPIIGVSEDGQIDFKSEPYNLRTEHGKFELAKDVAAFAGGQGDAVIVLGVETETPPDSPFEHAARARPIPRRLIDEKQLRKLIGSRVYPGVRGVGVNVYPSAADASRCLVAVHIPEQRDEDKPFLVLSPLAPDGAKILGLARGRADASAR